MLSEQEVSRSWRRLLNSPDVSIEALSKAESLLDELRPESPLRHRLEQELIEIKKLRGDSKRKSGRSKDVVKA